MTTTEHAIDFDPAQHATEIAERGYTILREVVPEDLRLQLIERIDRAMDAAHTDFGQNRFLGFRTRRLFNLLARDPAFAQVPTFEPAISVAEQVLDVELQVASVTAIEMNPGQEAQPFHADDGSIPLPRPHVPLSCVAIWALTDFTEHNGATRLVPGSHLADRRPNKGEAPEIWDEAVMPAGSIAIYNGSIWHGGGPNTTDTRRLAIVSQYSAGWIRQEENQLLALSREQVAEFPPRLRKMIGYGTYRGLMGHVDQVDPGTWFDPDAETDMIWRKMR
jgi:ectoine hydroxylase-related dioxygenase (phytanoyl-CoA dioxygenase family)